MRCLKALTCAMFGLLLVASSLTAATSAPYSVTAIVAQNSTGAIYLGATNPDGTPRWNARWETVPAPKAAVWRANIGWSPNTQIWGNTFHAGGVFEVYNYLVDKNNKVGARSQGRTITVKPGWCLFGDASNQPPVHDSVGVAWTMKCISIDSSSGLADGGQYQVGKEYAIGDNTSGVGPLQFRSPLPWAASPPYLQTFGFLEHYYPMARWTHGGTNTFVAPPPKVFASNVPVKKGNIQYCYVTHDNGVNGEPGETALSPPAIVSVSGGNDIPGASGVLSFSLGECPPMGALGTHIYLDGKRVPAPHCEGEPVIANDWLWPLEQFQGEIHRVVDNAPAHQAAVTPRSYLNKLQVAMMETTKSIMVDEDYLDLYCPMLDEYAMYPGSGGPGAFKFGRRIYHETGGDWYMTQMKSFTVDGVTYNKFPTYFSGMIVFNQKSKWAGLSLTMRYGRCGLSFLDYSGGQCFTNEYDLCHWTCLGLDPRTDQPQTPAIMTYGMWVDNRCQLAGHMASEQTFRNVGFTGRIAVWHACQQSANFIYDRVWAISYDPAGLPPDRRASCFWLSSPVPITFKGGVFAECPSNVIFNMGWMPDASVTDMWVDGGCVSLVDFTNGQPGRIEFVKGKANLWIPARGIRPNLARVYNTTDPIKMTFKGTTLQLNNNASEIDIYTMSFNKLSLWFEDSPFLQHSVLRQPTASAFYNAYSTYMSHSPTKPPAGSSAAVIKTWNDWIAFINPEPPSKSFTVPSSSITVPQSSFVINNVTYVVPAKKVAIPAKTVYFQSFDRPNTVKTVDWNYRSADPLIVNAAPPVAVDPPKE